MNEHDDQARTEAWLRRFALKEPSPDLKARTLNAAREAWEETPKTAPSLRRLLGDSLFRAAAALAAMLLFSCLVSRLDNRLTEGWGSGRPSEARFVSPGVEMPVGLAEICAELQMDRALCITLMARPVADEPSAPSAFLMFREAIEELKREDSRAMPKTEDSPRQDNRSSYRQIPTVFPS